MRHALFLLPALAVLFGGCSGPAIDPETHFVTTVLDAQTGRPIAGATLYALGGRYPLLRIGPWISDENGRVDVVIPKPVRDSFRPSGDEVTRFMLTYRCEAEGYEPSETRMGGELVPDPKRIPVTAPWRLVPRWPQRVRTIITQ